MPTYQLYLEQGPPLKRVPRRKTMVHVLDLLGCAPKAKSEEEALVATPATIDDYRRWLRGIGEDVPLGDIQLEIAERWQGEDSWNGLGYMQQAFQAELTPIDADEVERLVRRFEAMQQLIDAALDSLPPDDLIAKPDTGRALSVMALHVADAAHGYVTAGLGRVGEPGSKPDRPWRVEWDRVTDAVVARLRAMSDDERSQIRYSRDKGYPWTARKVLRRVLEHTWEHVDEMVIERLGRSL